MLPCFNNCCPLFYQKQLLTLGSLVTPTLATGHYVTSVLRICRLTETAIFMKSHASARNSGPSLTVLSGSAKSECSLAVFHSTASTLNLAQPGLVTPTVIVTPGVIATPTVIPLCQPTQPYCLMQVCDSVLIIKAGYSG